MLAFLAASALGSAFRLGARGLAGKTVASAKRDWTSIPPKVKLAMLALAISAVLVIVHQHHAHAARKASGEAGYARAKAEDAASLKTWRDRALVAEASGKAISQKTRSENDETNRGIAADADALRVRGPGAASCGRVDHPAVPAAGSQLGAPGDRSPDAAGGSVPAAGGEAGLAGVPWIWLVGRAEQCDLDRAEALSWRSWYQQQAAAWAALRAALAEPKP
jgi:hypothetical protein